MDHNPEVGKLKETEDEEMSTPQKGESHKTKYHQPIHSKNKMVVDFACLAEPRYIPHVPVEYPLEGEKLTRQKIDQKTLKTYDSDELFIAEYFNSDLKEKVDRSLKDKLIAKKDGRLNNFSESQINHDKIKPVMIVCGKSILKDAFGDTQDIKNSFEEFVNREFPQNHTIPHLERNRRKSTPVVDKRMSKTSDWNERFDVRPITV